MMPKITPGLSIRATDPALLAKLALVKRAHLALVATIAVIALCGWLLPAMGAILPAGWRFMDFDTALVLILIAVGMECSEAGHSRLIFRLSIVIALLAVFLAGLILFKYLAQTNQSIGTLRLIGPQTAHLFRNRSLTQLPILLSMLGISVILSRVHTRIAVIFADLIVMIICLLTLIQVSGFVFAGMSLFGMDTLIRTPPQTVLCVLLLSVVALLRRAEHGVFSIFLGRGIGSRIARGLTPVLLLLPFMREVGRARLIQALKIPEQDVTAILVSFATIISFILLLFLAWRLEGMEAEIQDLSLRDELTGLYNLRGFNLLAEQILRFARRSHLPISVLFIDLDNLKGINDTFGHATGSAFLAETADMLRDAFRETDVLGRIGGDEFVVVCQCSRVAVSIAAERLKSAARSRNAKDSQRNPLSFSVGLVTSEEHANETLKELLTSADKAMYEEKRRKKLVSNPDPSPTIEMHPHA